MEVRTPNRLQTAGLHALWLDDTGAQTQEAWLYQMNTTRPRYRGTDTRTAVFFEGAKAYQRARLGYELPYMLCGHTE